MRVYCKRLGKVDNSCDNVRNKRVCVGLPNDDMSFFLGFRVKPVENAAKGIDMLFGQVVEGVGFEVENCDIFGALFLYFCAISRAALVRELRSYAFRGFVASYGFGRNTPTRRARFPRLATMPE